MNIYGADVKNGFSDLTKEQKGRDWPRKDVMNSHQVKALREGCHEIKEVWMGVSSREKINTNRNLARATTKSRARRRQSLMYMSVKGEKIGVLRSVPTSETLSNEQDRSQVVLRAMFNGDKTYDNRTGEI